MTDDIKTFVIESLKNQANTLSQQRAAINAALQKTVAAITELEQTEDKPTKEPEQ